MDKWSNIIIVSCWTTTMRNKWRTYPVTTNSRRWNFCDQTATLYRWITKDKVSSLSSAESYWTMTPFSVITEFTNVDQKIERSVYIALAACWQQENGSPIKTRVSIRRCVWGFRDGWNGVRHLPHESEVKMGDKTVSFVCFLKYCKTQVIFI